MRYTITSNIDLKIHPDIALRALLLLCDGDTDGNELYKLSNYSQRYTIITFNITISIIISCCYVYLHTSSSSDMRSGALEGALIILCPISNPISFNT